MSAHEMAEHMMMEHPDKGAMSAHKDKEMSYHK